MSVDITLLPIDQVSFDGSGSQRPKHKSRAYFRLTDEGDPSVCCVDTSVVPSAASALIELKRGLVREGWCLGGGFLYRCTKEL